MPSGSAPQRLTAQRNRERILDVAREELTHDPETPLSAIVKKVGVGQATFYRNFPNREALVFEIYRYETAQLTEYAAALLQTTSPDEALRKWLDRLAQYAMTKTGLAGAIRHTITAPVSPSNPAYTSIVEAANVLLEANADAGLIRPEISADDLLLAIAGLWHIPSGKDGRVRADRLIALVIDGLRVGAPKTFKQRRDRRDIYRNLAGRG